MKKALLSVALGVFAAGYGAAAMANDDDRNSLVKFIGGIGSQPFANVGGVPAPNDVLGVPPGGRPWPIDSLRAVVHTDSTITVKGQGMILGGGANVGRPAIPRQVVATLFCGTTPFHSAPVDLDAAGDFTIRSPLSGVVPNPCLAPVLLIRNFGITPPATVAAPGPWFAAGIPAN